MVETSVLAISVLLQFTAAFLALRLIHVTGGRVAWILLSTAISLMAIRRTITLFRLITEGIAHPPDITAELVALATSALMVVGIAYIPPLFLSIKRSEGELREHRVQLEELVEERTDELKTINKQLQQEVTERNCAEEEIRKLNKELEQSVIELREVNKELEAFSYSASHNLRAPLRAIDGFSRVLSEDYHDKLDAEGKRILNILRDNTQNMGQLIDDLLAFSRLGRQQMAASDVDMSKLAKVVFEELKAITPGRTLQFDIKELPPAHGDGAMIREVFVNLLSNAIKFTRPKETAVIEIGSREQKNENTYYVKDNGIGFDMQYADKLFGVFQRLHTTDEFEGTGVGLAIVQRIIHRHGGRVWAEGKVNEGATFYFTLAKSSPG